SLPHCVEQICETVALFACPLVRRLIGEHAMAHVRIPRAIEIQLEENAILSMKRIKDRRQDRKEAPGPERREQTRRSHERVLIEVEGEVICINPLLPHDTDGRNPGMGIKFVDMTPKQREDVLKLVRTFAYLNDEEDDGRVGNS